MFYNVFCDQFLYVLYICEFLHWSDDFDLIARLSDFLFLWVIVYDFTFT